MAETNKHMPRGAIASPRHELAAAEPHTITGQTPQLFFKIPKKLSFWGNNTYGDCVTAEEAFAKACHTQEIFISDQEVEQWATAHNVLNGAVIVSVMQAMGTDGFKQGRHTYDDGGYKSVNWTDAAVLQMRFHMGQLNLGSQPTSSTVFILTGSAAGSRRISIKIVRRTIASPSAAMER